MCYLEILNNILKNTVIINLRFFIMLKPNSISTLPPYSLAQGICQDLHLVNMDSHYQGSLLGSLHRHPPPAAHLFLTDPMTTGSLFWCAVSPTIGTLFRKYVRCPPSQYTHFLCGVPPPFSSVPWTLWLCLGFWAKLRIWQVPACKLKPSSTCILECGTPSWACMFFLMSKIISYFTKSRRPKVFSLAVFCLFVVKKAVTPKTFCH